jgi:glutamate dehydrogenase
MQQKNKFFHLVEAKGGQDKNLDEKFLKKAQERAWEIFNNVQNPFNLDLILEEDNLVVIVRMKDYSFIVDSLLLVMKDLPLKQLFLSIPVFSVTRNEKGLLQEFDEGFGPNQESLSLLIFQKLASLDLEAIRLQIEETLSMVIAVNEGWLAAKKSAASFNNDFCDWLLDNNFIFLASFDWIDGESKNLEGLVKKAFYPIELILKDESFDQELSFRRSSLISKVHRNTNMEIISIKRRNNYYSFFIGFFTSAVYFQPVTQIPFIKDKINLVIKKNPELISEGYLLKEVIAELQSYPRSELFQITEEDLTNLISGLVSIIKFPKIKIFLRTSSDGFKNLLLFIPKEKFSMDLQGKIEKILSDRLELDFFKRYMKISEGPFMTLQFIVKSRQEVVYDIKSLEREIEDLLSHWEEKFKIILSNFYQKSKLSYKKFQKFIGAFSPDYKYKNTPEEAAIDLLRLENLSAKPSLYFLDDNKIKIYSKDKLEISTLIPKIDNLAFLVVEMESYNLVTEGINYHLYTFLVKPKKQVVIDKDFLEENFQRIIFNPKLEEDYFNSLITLVGLNWQEVLITRAYAAYLKQLLVNYDKIEIVDAFSENPEATKIIFNFFHEKFSKDNKPEVLKKLQLYLEDLLFKVENALSDKILRDYFNVIKATKRSNILWGEEGDFLAFKIAPQELNIAPLPKPFREIFIYSNEFEALHMRSNKVARGGIRWSDRKLDYRTELLGLLKAQMSKNSIIVPDGAKGVFVLKNSSPLDKDLFMQKGIAAYESFLSGLLDLTDNFLDNQLILTDKTIIWDEADPYLVVAADKGTATFSDRANKIALERNFWLGDAFASGGSAGYDHKKLAITSKGAWISVEEHGKSIGLNPNKDEITVVGIGDMSGDVFGNGLLRSKNLKLVAAFNHLHIFLDPNPDPAKSFEERLRLFNLPYSQWKDYNPLFISQGGGVFDRTAKAILLSSEIKKVLGIVEDCKELTPPNLIKAILKAPVDLLWNGGIGTYVKASYESNSEAGDKFNDNLRVDGKELRCKMVAEGGNLGFTQLGRIEYAKKGGLINSDAIDNSGGVDCSDHEVNIKIALNNFKNHLSTSDRNKLLEELEPAVVELVLEDNRKQNHIISLSQENTRLEEKIWLIKTLEERDELNPKLEKLPSYEELEELDSFTRPELAVLLAYAKNSAVRALLQEEELENLLELEVIKKIYLNYFPSKLQEMPYLEALENHKLKKEILATILVNELINSMGIDYFHLEWLKNNKKPYILVKNFFIIKYGLGLNNLVNNRKLQLLIESKMVALPDSLDNNFYLQLKNLNNLLGKKALEILLVVSEKDCDYLKLYENYLFISQNLPLDSVEIFSFLADKLPSDTRLAVLILLSELEKKVILLAVHLSKNHIEKEKILNEIVIADKLMHLEGKESGQILANLILIVQKIDGILPS